jgi:uncharacterized protein (TIGR02145 family)
MNERKVQLSQSIIFICIHAILFMVVGCKDKKVISKVFNEKNIPTITSNDTTSFFQVEIKLGDVIWSTQNLNVTTYRNGDTIPEVKDPIEWSKLTTGAWCYLNNVSDNGNCYGKLYNWYAINDPRGLAPEGYHIPSENEWNTSIKSLGGIKVANKTMRSISGWTGNIGTNTSGFTALPASYRSTEGTFYNAGYFAGWWSVTQNKNKAILYGIGWDLKTINSEYIDKHFGCSVRCVKN